MIMNKQNLVFYEKMNEMRVLYKINFYNEELPTYSGYEWLFMFLWINWSSWDECCHYFYNIKNEWIYEYFEVFLSSSINESVFNYRNITFVITFT